MEPAAGHLASASQALTETTQTLTDLTENAVALKPELESTRKIIQQIQSDTSSLRELIDSVESYNKSASVIASNLEDDFYYMSDQMDDLQSSLSALENTLSRISGMSTVDEITIEGMSIYELRESAAATANAHQLYLQNVPEGDAGSGHLSGFPDQPGRWTGRGHGRADERSLEPDGERSGLLG